MIAIIFLSLTIGMVNSEMLGEDPKGNDIATLYNNILIGELLPSGNIYLERFSFDGGFDNEQNFKGLNYADQIQIYPIIKAKWDSVRASFSSLINSTYIGEAEKESRYFNYPFSQARQDALLYKIDRKTTDTPMTVIAINKYHVEKVIYFGGSDMREYSAAEYKEAMDYIRDDHERKDKYDSTLSKITRAKTILKARKMILLHIKDVGYDVLLSVYRTHGIEYAATVYVIDFIKNGKTIMTKKKYNTDGPY